MPMNRTEFEHFILDHYGITPDYPWMKYPNFAVFRHINSQKWFALVMDIPKNKLGLHGTDLINVVNLKCDPILIGSLRSEPGFFPAYHMNKDGWITVALDGSVPDEKIKMLLGMSCEMTAPKTPKKKGPQPPKSKYPESFFNDLARFAKKDILSTSDTNYADYLISLVEVSEFLSPAMKPVVMRVLTEHYKENKSLTQISGEINRSLNQTGVYKRRGLAAISRLLRTTMYPNSIDEYKKAIEELTNKDATRYTAQDLALDTSIDQLNIPVKLFYTLVRNGISTVGALLDLTGEEQFNRIGKTTWKQIQDAQKQARKRLIDNE